MWQLAASLWHDLSEAEVREWERAGTKRGMTGFAAYMSEALRPNPGIYLPLAGGVMTGEIDMDGHNITDLLPPDEDLDAATKEYVDAHPVGFTAGCRVYHNANYGIADATAWVVHPFNSEEYDTDTMHDNVVNNERITCKTAGKYLVVFQAKWDADLNGRRIIGIRKNGATFQAFSEQEIPSGGTGTFNHFLLTVVSLAVTDYVEAVLFQNSGGVLNTIYNAGVNCYFIAQRIG